MFFLASGFHVASWILFELKTQLCLTWAFDEAFIIHRSKDYKAEEPRPLRPLLASLATIDHNILYLLIYY